MIYFFNKYIFVILFKLKSIIIATHDTIWGLLYLVLLLQKNLHTGLHISSSLSLFSYSTIASQTTEFPAANSNFFLLSLPLGLTVGLFSLSSQLFYFKFLIFSRIIDF